VRSDATGAGVDLRGQVAVVTGGGRGLGRAFAQALAAAGAAVAVLARSADELAETVAAVERAGGRAREFRADVTDAAVVRTAIAAVEQALGPVDLLVNNAGVAGPFGPFWETDPDTWWRAVDVNLRGQILCAHAVLRRWWPVAAGASSTWRAEAVPGPFRTCRRTSRARRR